MKEMPLLMKYVFFLLLMSFFACEKGDSWVISPETEMYINSYKTDCTGMGSLPCLLVQEGSLLGSEEWILFNDPIQGFNYEEGYYYHLKVRIEKILNPAPDASDRKYILLQLISKQEAPNVNRPSY
jgi:hypothetical protein